MSRAPGARPRSVNPLGVDKFAGVEAAPQTNDAEVIKARLEQNENDTNRNNFGDDYEWIPAFSRLQVKVTDKFTTQTKTESGLVIVESKAKLPYIEVEITGVGSNAGWNDQHSIQYQGFSVGDIVRVFEKHVEFHYLDGKGHNEFYQPGRPYVAYVQDKFVIALRGGKK